MKVNISLLQINVFAGEPEKNFNRVENFLLNLPKHNLHFAILPELWSSGYNYSNIKYCAEYTKNNFYKILEIAKKKNLFIIGSVPWIDKGSLFNRNLIVNPSGEIEDFYDKIHLFKPLYEHQYFKQGEKVCILNNKNFNYSVALCYDLRFPELFRRFTLNNCEIVFISAQWPLSRIEHWILLNRARAVENQIFIVSCNRVGESLGINFGGNSMIISPSGDIICQLDTSEKIFTCQINTDEILKAKSIFDIKKDILIKNI